jgi:hypothetical protein
VAVLKRNIDITIILFVGFILRFTISIIHSYSNDELSAISRLRFDNFNDLVSIGVKTGDMHPAGVQFFLKFWSSLFGTSELALRFPFVIFGTLSILILFLIGKKWFSRKAGLIAALFLATLYFPVINAEFARPYSIGLLLMLSIVMLWYDVLFDKSSSWLRAIGLGLLYAMAMYTHYFLFVCIAVVGITGLFFLNKQNFKFYLLAAGIGVVLFLPHVSITVYHLSVGGLEWLAPPGPWWLFEFLYFAFNSDWILIAVLIALLVVGVFTKRNFNEYLQERKYLPVVLFLGIFLTGFVLSYAVTPLLKFPVMLFAFPFFLLAIGQLYARFLPDRAWTILISLLLLYSTIFHQQLYKPVHYGLFKELSAKIIEWEDMYGADNMYKIVNVNNARYLNFYSQQEGREIDLDWSSLEYHTTDSIREALVNRKEEYCIVGYSARHTLPQVFEYAKEFYPVVVDKVRYNNSTLYLLKRGARKMNGQLIGAFDQGTIRKGNWNINPEKYSKRFALFVVRFGHIWT